MNKNAYWIWTGFKQLSQRLCLRVRQMTSFLSQSFQYVMLTMITATAMPTPPMMSACSSTNSVAFSKQPSVYEFSAVGALWHSINWKKKLNIIPRFKTKYISITTNMLWHIFSGGHKSKQKINSLESEKIYWFTFQKIGVQSCYRDTVMCTESSNEQRFT